VARYIAPSTRQPVRAVLFDVFGTVVDWRTGIASAVAAFAARHDLELDASALADSWRGQYQPAMQRVRSGERPYVPLDVLHREGLDVVLGERGLAPADFGPPELDELTRAWHFLPPWPDSVAGIAAIKRGYVTGPLSNGNTALLVDMAKGAGLAWDVVLGSDVSRAYKPSPEAYLAPARFLGVGPGEVMLVAAHNADLASARQLGLATAYIPRPAEFGPHTHRNLAPTAGWDVLAESIIDLAGRLAPTPQ